MITPLFVLPVTTMYQEPMFSLDLDSQNKVIHPLSLGGVVTDPVALKSHYPLM